MPEVEFDEEQPHGSKLKGMETKETNTMEKAVAPAGQDTTEEELDIEKRDKEELARMGKLPQYKVCHRYLHVSKTLFLMQCRDFTRSSPHSPSL